MRRETYTDKSTLVAGGAGFIGSHLVNRRQSDGAK